MCPSLGVGVENEKDIQSKKQQTFTKIQCFSKNTSKFVNGSSNVKSVVKQVITRATPGKSLVYHKNQGEKNGSVARPAALYLWHQRWRPWSVQPGLGRLLGAWPLAQGATPKQICRLGATCGAAPLVSSARGRWVEASAWRTLSVPVRGKKRF